MRKIPISITQGLIPQLPSLNLRLKLAEGKGERVDNGGLRKLSLQGAGGESWTTRDRHNVPRTMPREGEAKGHLTSRYVSRKRDEDSEVGGRWGGGSWEGGLENEDWLSSPLIHSLVRNSWSRTCPGVSVEESKLYS